MKRIIITLLLFYPFVACAQVSQAEINKLLKEAKDMLKQQGDDTLINQKLKELEKNEKQFSDILKNNPSSLADSKPGAFPARQTKLLSLVSKKVVTKAEVKIFAAQLYGALKKTLPARYVQSAQNIIASLNNDAQLVMETAVAAAHLNAGEEAVLLAAYAASTLPEPNILNNSAAIFTMAGLEPAAISLLKHLLPAYQNNTTVLNNMGQAYAALGEKDSAMFFFGRTIKLNPNHAQARYCAGVIENSKGNKKTAQEHLQNSLQGAYDPDASRLVRFLDPGFRMNRFAKPQIKIPEYFNIHKYLPFPLPCNSTDDIPRAVAEYKQYIAMLDEEIKKFQKPLLEAQSASEAILKGVTNNYKTGYTISKESVMAKSYYGFYQQMVVDLALEMGEKAKTVADEEAATAIELKKIENIFIAEIANLRKQYEGEGEEFCSKYNALASIRMQKSNALIQNMQLKILHPWQNFNERAYWDYLLQVPFLPKPAGLHNFRAVFYSGAISYLQNLKTYARQVIVEKCKGSPVTTAPPRQGGDITEPACPFEVKAEYKIFEFAFDCEKSSFTISAGDNIKFVYSKDNFSKASSIEIEMGIEDKNKLEIIPGYTSSLGAGITESLMVEFDKEGKFSDFQIKGGVKVSASANKKGISPEVKTGEDAKISVETKDDATVTKLIKPQSLWKDSEKFTYTFSMKNGFSYEDGLLRPIADAVMGTKPDVQINKNVNPYQTKNK